MNFLFVITGGIAEYKVIEAIRFQIKSGNHVKVVMTQMAKQFITPLTFSTLTNEPVYDDFLNDTKAPVAHVALADWADYVVIAPATANFIGKMANGIADDFASTVVMAAATTKMVLPAMNSNMWDNPAVQRNLQVLKADGVKILEPVEGMLAEGYSGKGRFPDASVVNEFISSVKNSNGHLLTGVRILVTAGGTREKIDPVRFIGNRSSGKMGFAIAEQADQLGADVTLITGPTSLDIPAGRKISRVNIESVQELQDAIEDKIQQVDILIMAAAVSDFRVAQASEHKLKKSDSTNQMQLNLIENPDILAELNRPKTLQYVAGFAAETENLLKNAQDKMDKKNLDMIIANDVGNRHIGFDVDENAVTIIRPNTDNIVVKKNSKTVIANKILRVIAEEIQRKG